MKKTKPATQRFHVRGCRLGDWQKVMRTNPKQFRAKGDCCDSYSCIGLKEFQRWKVFKQHIALPYLHRIAKKCLLSMKHQVIAAGALNSKF